MKCKCAIETKTTFPPKEMGFIYQPGGCPDPQIINYCPLHAAAPEMLEFIKELRERIKELENGRA